MKYYYKLLYFFAKVYWKIFQPFTIGVVVMLVKHNKVVLLKQAYETGWQFPGGGVKKGETHEQGVSKSGEIAEVKEFELTNLPKDIFPGTKRRINEYINGEYPNFGEW
jgi:8-oxo-dGTP pyrophosphatase MutT (NUDIX family)